MSTPRDRIEDRHPYREGLLIVAAMVISGIITVSVSVYIVSKTDLLKTTREVREPGPRAPVIPVIPERARELNQD